MAKTFRSVAMKLGLITAIATVVSSNAFAQRYYMPAFAHYGAAYGPAGYMSDIPCATGCTATQQAFYFGFSGTRGRLGLGANALRPEGPGNVSN